MRRILKCDGFLPQKMDSKGELEEVTPHDLRQMKAYIDFNRALTTPFDYVAEGKTGELDLLQVKEKMRSGLMPAQPGGWKAYGKPPRSRLPIACARDRRELFEL
jgi:hypothetical protein